MWLTRYRTHYVDIARLGIPLIVGQLGNILLGFADTLMVGRYDTQSLGAAAFVNNLYNLVIITFLGFSYGLTPLVSALFARKEYAKTGALLKNAVVSNFLFGGIVLLIMGILYFFLDEMGQPDELLPLIRPYYVVVWCSMFFVILFNLFRQLSDGIGRTTVGMWIILGGNVLNVVLNALLIYGIGPFPELGLLGAGLATLTSRVVMGLLIVFIVFRCAEYLPYRRGYLSGKLSWPDVHLVTRKSLPVALQMGMETSAFSLSAVMVGWIGTIELASYQIVVTIGTLGYLFYYSLGAAMTIRVANFVGLNNWVEVRRCAFAACHMLLGMMLIADCAFWFLGQDLIDLFTTDEQVRLCSCMLIVPLILYQFGDAMQICFANAIRGTSHVATLILYAFISFMLVCLPLAYVLGFPCGGGIIGIYLAFSIGLFLAAVLYFFSFMRITREKLLSKA